MNIGSTVLRHRIGLILVGIGTSLLVFAGIGALVPGNNESEAAAGANISTVTDALNTTTTAAPVTSTLSTSVQTTTTAATTTSQQTTTTAAATTTTLAPKAAITAFIDEFGAAIAAEDTKWLIEHLHPAMILGYGEDLCRTFINNDILALTQYTLIGSVVGPVAKTLNTAVGTVTVEGIYEAETSFVFQGTQFDAQADFVLGDQITWIATCR